MYVLKEVFDKRIRICKECENLEGTVCQLCGCQVDLKCNFKYEKCPIGKW